MDPNSRIKYSREFLLQCRFRGASMPAGRLATTFNPSCDYASPDNYESWFPYGDPSARYSPTSADDIPKEQPTPVPNQCSTEGVPDTSSADKRTVMERQMESLKKILECPVCLHVQGVQMFLCTQGHSICQTCREKLDKCPLCQHPFMKTRNLLAEQIIGTMDVDCPYTAEGCTNKKGFPDVSKGPHVSNCFYRPMECNFSTPFYRCKTSTVKYSDFVQHLKIVHNINGVNGSIMNMSQSTIPETAKLATEILWHEWPVQYMEVFDQTFLTGTAVLEGSIFWWLYVFGDREIADNYHCKIVVQHKGKGLEFTWSGPVFPIRCEPMVIKKTGLCLTVNKESLQAISYPKMASQIGGSDVEKIAWDLEFHIYKRAGHTSFS